MVRDDANTYFHFTPLCSACRKKMTQEIFGVWSCVPCTRLVRSEAVELAEWLRPRIRPDGQLLRTAAGNAEGRLDNFVKAAMRAWGGLDGSIREGVVAICAAFGLDWIRTAFVVPRGTTVVTNITAKALLNSSEIVAEVMTALDLILLGGQSEKRETGPDGKPDERARTETGRAGRLGDTDTTTTSTTEPTAIAATRPDGDLPPARHSADFTSVYWYGDNYHFTEKQAMAVSEWWTAWKNRTPALRDETVITEIGLQVKDKRQAIRDLFKGHSSYGNMIVVGPRKGTHQLADPPKEI